MNGYICLGIAIGFVVGGVFVAWHSPDNLCVACTSCNSSKGAKDLDEWIEWKARVAEQLCTGGN